MSAAHPQVAVGIILFDAAGRVLLIQRGHAPAKGRWSIPGGRVEPGERLKDACLRELRAETGLEADIGELFGVFEHLDEDHHYIILDYLAQTPRGRLCAGEDASEVRFVPLADVSSLETTAGLLEVLTSAFKRACGAP